ncbi:MAG TPA: sigma-54-dependent Fis family transcriptional regulator [Nitrospirae bacterium]|nr:sigma-54-dependent Fis family transcriptional regulator [Nitrospirota bacterium]
MKRVLLVDDEEDMLVALKESVKRCGFAPITYKNPLEALEKTNLSDFSLIITDMKMSQMNGLELLSTIRKRGIFIPVIVITGYGTVENAVEAMKLGATDYIMKPFSFDSLKETITRIMPDDELEMVAESSVMSKIIATVRDIASSDISILLSGQSGTGKEVVARYIHKMSSRADKPFVAINCAAISETLLESELFGFEKGAFTGATERRTGKFELANKGTILLDEISEMAFPLQAKLLRVIQEKEIDRIGGRLPVPVDVRIIATTNRDLLTEVRQGRFREDLYYRLNVFPIKIPPLAERHEDIIPLAEFFLKKLSIKMGKTFYLSDELKEHLLRRKWEGNVRELENLIYRIVVISKSEKLFLPEFENISNRANKDHFEIIGSVKDMEKELILKTLKENNWNQRKSAMILGLNPRTIRNKLKDYGIKVWEMKELEKKHN